MPFPDITSLLVYSLQDNKFQNDEDQNLPKFGQFHEDKSGSPEATVQTRGGFTDFINKFLGQFSKVRSTKKY